MPTSEPDQEAANARREFLLGAIHHSQAVIGSLESRVPMALLLHGLVFTGLLDITVHVGSIIRHHDGWRIIVIALIGLILVSFLVSVLALLTSITPPLSPTPGIADPTLLRFDGVAPGLFFPTITDRGLQKYPPLGDRHRELTVDSVEETLSANLLMLAAFRTYKTGLARIGFWWLRIELVLAIVYVVVAGIAALTI